MALLNPFERPHAFYFCRGGDLNAYLYYTMTYNGQPMYTSFSFTPRTSLMPIYPPREVGSLGWPRWKILTKIRCTRRPGTSDCTPFAHLHEADAGRSLLPKPYSALSDCQHVFQVVLERLYFERDYAADLT